MITNIQRYSIHDGAGIRTTVFFKGCPLRCIWCHNPEAQVYAKQILYNKERCIACRQCEKACPYHAISYRNGILETDPERCKGCGSCIDSCVYQLREITGTYYPVEELFQELCKDLMFYEQSGGGVTLSGGEVMSTDMDFIEELVNMLYKEGISVNIDTCGYANYENFERILPFVDTFLYDLKVLEPDKHKHFTGTDNTLILKNLRKLSKDGARINLRIPVITEVNGSNQDMADMIRWLIENEIRVTQINLLPYHNLSSSKYERLGIPYCGGHLHAPSEEELLQFVEQFKASGFHPVKIGG